MPVEAYPLAWPANFDRTKKPERARFSADKRPVSIAVARTRVMEEIGRFTRVGQTYRINPSMVVISSNIPTRKDGMPYSIAKEPDDSGVAVYFELDGEPKVFPCDKWDRVADNLAAIAAHLSAMRGMERWGVGNGKAHYAGFAALEHRPERQWWEIIGCEQDDDPIEIEAAYRAARKKAHPDHGGSTDEFQEVQAAYQKYKISLGGE